jgi:hypothetical protein
VSEASQATDLAAAITSEAEIAARAADIRKGKEVLTPALLDELHPLLREPIPSAFIQTVGRLEGKPYASTGIRSVQVQIDRMNNVLGLSWWDFEEDFEADGKLAKVTVYIGNPGETPLAKRSSRGGVDRGTGTGNRYKGSFTNAAKLAFARVGPGHEVYVGAADLDPDVNEAVAKQTGGGAINESAAKALAERAFRIPAAQDALQMAASHVAESEIGDCSTVEKAAKALTSLTFEQAEKLDSWIKRKETESGVDGTALDEERAAKVTAALDAARPTLAEQGVNWLDGLNVLLGSLGIDGFDPNTATTDEISQLDPADADKLIAALEPLAKQGGGEPDAD